MWFWTDFEKSRRMSSAAVLHNHSGFPMNQFLGASAQMPNQRTTSPIVTGSSVIALVYNEGVMVMSDTLASYGSLARFKDVQRVTKVNDTTIIAASGEFSDYQYLCKLLENLVTEDFVQDDGAKYSPQELYSYVCRIMYHRRSKFDPLYNEVVVSGWKDGKGLVGVADMQGTHFTGDFVATGMAAHLAIPILRENWKADLNRDQAKDLLEQCMRVLFYRDCRTINRYHLATVSADGVTISEPYKLSTQWSYSRFVNPGEPSPDKPVQKFADARGRAVDEDEMKVEE